MDILTRLIKEQDRNELNKRTGQKYMYIIKEQGESLITFEGLDGFLNRL